MTLGYRKRFLSTKQLKTKIVIKRMVNMKLTKSRRLNLLNEFIQKWINQENSTRSHVVVQVIDKCKELGLEDLLAEEGITFHQTDDVLKDMNANQQKVFRWLGCFQEVNAAPVKIFEFEPAILAAMPKNLRISYLNHVYGISDVFVGARNSEDGQIVDIGTVTASLIKESAEAQMALVKLNSKPSRKAAEKAMKELDDHIGQGLAAQNTLREEFGLEMKNHRNGFTRTGAVVSSKGLKLAQWSLEL